MPEKTQRRRAGGQSRPRRAGGAQRSTSSRGPKPRPANKNIQPLEPVLDPPEIESFAEFDLGDETQGAIAAMGITTPTPIQALAIEPVLKGKDVIAKAETGTGKTLAFGAPMMAKIDPSRSTVLGLVLSPTRELAEQVHDVLEKLGEARGVKTALVVGGEQMGPQVRKIQAGAQVIVGTPGRVLDLLNQKFLQFPWTEFAILDEADKMLEIGFIDDVKKILDACNEYRQTLLFSATFPPPLLELARGYTNDPVEIATASGVATVDNIHQYYLRCSEDDRARELSHLIEDSAGDDVFLVFCERRTDVDRLMRKLERRRFSVKALHGGYDQAARFRVMSAFRTGDVKCLVATDVASRGLDVAHVTHVVNLGVPRDVSDYTHRIGRTGRAGRHGVAITFVSRKDERRFSDLERASGFDLREVGRPRELFALERKRARAGEDDDGPGGTEQARDGGRRPGGRDEDDREPRRRGRRDRGGDEEPRRARRRERTRGESTEDATEDATEGRRERRPRRGRSGDEDTGAERRPRRRRDRDEAPRARRDERPAPAPAESPAGSTAEPPAASTADAPSSGFGAGLSAAARAEAEVKEKKTKKSRGRKRGDDRDDGPRDSGAKGQGRRTKKSARGENAAPESKPSPRGGFGAGL